MRTKKLRLLSALAITSLSLLPSLGYAQLPGGGIGRGGATMDSFSLTLNSQQNQSLIAIRNNSISIQFNNSLTGKANVFLTDSFGKIVYSNAEIKPKEQKQLQIPTQNLQPGFYTLNIKNQWGKTIQEESILNY